MWPDTPMSDSHSTMMLGGPHVLQIICSLTSVHNVNNKGSNTYHIQYIHHIKSKVLDHPMNSVDVTMPFWHCGLNHLSTKILMSSLFHIQQIFERETILDMTFKNMKDVHHYNHPRPLLALF